MTPDNSYTVLAQSVEYCHEEKRSSFTAILQPAATRETALTLLEEVKIQRPGASHYCWAYVLGAADQPQSQAFSDDGEPAGTAGRPMLHVLTHRGAGDCMAVVVRLFGGIKLGAGGLVRAYGAAVAGALERAEFLQVSPKQALQIGVGFAEEERVRHLLASYDVAVDDVIYAQHVTLSVAITAAQTETLRAAVMQLTAGNARWVENLG